VDLPAKGFWRYRRTAFLLAGALAVALIAMALRPSREIEGTLRIGFQNSQPYHFPDADGHPSGPAVDLIKIAAEHEGIQLTWVFAPAGPEQSLRSGIVDLWPMLADMPERRQFLYISPPWARLTYALVFPASQPIPTAETMKDKPLAVMAKIASDARTARKFFPGSSLGSISSPTEIVQAVCGGDVPAGLISVNAIVVTPPIECGARTLRIHPLDGATYWFGIGAGKTNRRAQMAANRLRERIGLLANDGTLVDLDFRWRSRHPRCLPTTIAFGTNATHWLRLACRS
jgi:hypothetical protein